MTFPRSHGSVWLRTPPDHAGPLSREGTGGAGAVSLAGVLGLEACLSTGLGALQVSEAASRHLPCCALSNFPALVPTVYSLPTNGSRAFPDTAPPWRPYSGLFQKAMWKPPPENTEVVSCNSPALFICQISGWTCFKYMGLPVPTRGQEPCPCLTVGSGPGMDFNPPNCGVGMILSI